VDLLYPAPYWPIADGIPAVFPALDRDLTVDVAVIGAGISGALAAWHLAADGIETVVIDRREAVHGSTAGSTSLLQYEIDTPLHVLARQYGAEGAEYCYRRSCAAVPALADLVRGLQIDCAFEPRPSLLLASGTRHVPLLKREFEARHRAGLAVEWWSRSQVRRASTLPHPAAILSSVGAQVDAYRLAYGLLLAAQRRGVRIFDRTSVIRQRPRGNAVELITDRGARIRARQVVVASGYEADRLLPKQLTELHSTFALISEPIPRFSGWPANRCLIWETADPYIYLRTTEDGRAIIGGLDVPFRDPVARDRLVGAKAAALHARFRRLFPRIKFEPAYAWAGTFAKTQDGLPLIGEHPRHPRTWFALGYGGNGITFSLIAAEMLRDRLRGRPRRADGHFGFGRLRLT
jgi:glycine/D-amino acid oxidase-like deaminating enzyme